MNDDNIPKSYADALSLFRQIQLFEDSKSEKAIKHRYNLLPCYFEQKTNPKLLKCTKYDQSKAKQKTKVCYLFTPFTDDVFAFIRRCAQQNKPNENIFHSAEKPVKWFAHFSSFTKR